MRKRDLIRSDRRSRSLPIAKKLIYACIPTLVVLGGLELSLAMLGVEPLINTRDPFVGFSNQVSLMEETVDSEGRPMLVTRTSKLVWFNHQEFLKSKPPNTFRVFCMGGSTTFGRPYTDLTSYCGWLREFLPLVDDSREWEVINAGGVSYASYRVAMLMEELARYEPDLFIVYSVHNEFLENRTYSNLAAQPKTWLDLQALLSRTRLFTLSCDVTESWRGSTEDPVQSSAARRLPLSTNLLPAEVDERLNHTIGPADYQRDPEWEQGVLTHYASNLERMVRIARSAGAKIVFVSPASNLKDCSPFKGLPGTLGSPLKEAVQELVSQIGALIAANDMPQALEVLQTAASLDPENADVQFWLGRALMVAGREAEAEKAFNRALNEDVCPLRAIDEIDEAIHHVARERGVPVIEFGQRLSEQCLRQFGHRCLGQEYFLDHVHPTVEVHQQLARWILSDLQRVKIVSGIDIDDPRLATRIEQINDRQLEKINRSEHGVALRNLAKVLHWAGKFSEAAPRARDAIEWLGDDAESRFVLADCLKNMSMPAEARQQYELLFQNYPNYSRAFLPFGELLTDLGEDEKGLGYLLSAILVDPDDAYAHYTLGRNHLLRQEFEFAIEALELANTLQPQDPKVLELLQEAREGEDLNAATTAPEGEDLNQ